MTIIYIRKLRFHEARSKFLKELEKSFSRGETEIEVIHGIGTYALRKMVEEEINQLDYAELIPNNLNPGAVRVQLHIPDPNWLLEHVVSSKDDNA